MAVARTQIDAIVTKIQGTRDLSAGGVSALKEVLYLLADQMNSISDAPVVLATASSAFPNGQVAVANGAIIIAPNTPTAGEIEFKV